MKSKIDADELNLVKLAQEYSDEDKARALFESWRWPNGKPVCPHCKHDESYKLESKASTKASNKIRNGLYCCAACRKTFTATVGTILEDSHVPIGKWLMAIFILCSSKKSISANQLHRMLGVTYKTAWFMAHRIRFAMMPDPAKEPKLNGVTEIDETYVGGKGENRTKSQRKVPVIALVQRNGSMRTAVVSDVTQKNLRKVITENVSKDAILNTDESMVYKRQFKDYKRHDTVVHRKLEYTRKNPDGSTAGVNSCESFFSLLKRGVVGSWHHVSREHLPKYANEFAFRWNTRHDTDGKRTEKFIPLIEGRRLTYKKAA